MVKPIEAGNDALRRKYEEAITMTASVIPFDLKAARRYASIRRDRSLCAPDAVQLACAAAAGVDLFINEGTQIAR
jgi:predicted nucleic acid-binding protein